MTTTTGSAHPALCQRYDSRALVGGTMKMGLFVDSFQQPLNNRNREELKVSRGNRLYSSGLPIVGDGNLYILCREVNVG
jgi:hypothetical protein